MKAAIIAVLLSMVSGVPALAGTFVYVTNAEDGDIGMYTLQPDGSLRAGPRFKAEKVVMPMAVSPDKRFLIAAVRSKPYQAYSYSIDPVSGALRLVGTGPLAESFPYISLDRGGRFLLGASYGANLVSVNSVGMDGRVGDPLQVMPTARNAHSIRIDNTNRFAFAPHLGTDQVFQLLFDEKSGRLMANTPPILQLKQGTGPRHLIVSADNRFVHVLNELTGTVTTLSLDANTGVLKELDSVSVLPPDTKLVPGMPRGAVGTPGANQAPRNTDNDIWAADLHLTRRMAVFSTRPSGRRARWAHSGWMARAGSRVTSEARRPRSSPAGSPSIPPAASWSLPARSRTRSRRMRSTPRTARSNWSDAIPAARVRTGLRLLPSTSTRNH